MQGTAIISFPFISVIYGNLLQIKICLAYFGGFSRYLEIITNLEEKLSIGTYMEFRKPRHFLLTENINSSLFLNRFEMLYCKDFVTKCLSRIQRCFCLLKDKVQTQF